MESGKLGLTPKFSTLLAESVCFTVLKFVVSFADINVSVYIEKNGFLYCSSYPCQAPFLRSSI